MLIETSEDHSENSLRPLRRQMRAQNMFVSAVTGSDTEAFSRQGIRLNCRKPREISGCLQDHVAARWAERSHLEETIRRR